MQFDATLNIAWAVLGLFALTATARVALRERGRRNAPRWLLIVALIVTALFPYISASDDIVRMGHVPDAYISDATASISDSHSQDKNRNQTDDLLRLYETLDTPLVCRLIAIAFCFLLIAFILALNCARVTRTVPETAGRSPPLVAY